MAADMLAPTEALRRRVLALEEEIQELRRLLNHRNSLNCAYVRHRRTRRDYFYEPAGAAPSPQRRNASANLQGVSSAPTQRPSAALGVASTPTESRSRRGSARTVIGDGERIDPVAKDSAIELIRVTNPRMVSPSSTFREGLYCIRIMSPDRESRTSRRYLFIWIFGEDFAYAAMHRILWAMESPRIATADIEDYCPPVGQIVPDELESD